MPELYGRSLSLCICDIIEGKVSEADVQLIVTSTMASDRDSFQSLCNEYANTYWEWAGNGMLGKEIALRLYDSGKIEQPRLINPRASQALWDFPIWADCMSDVHNSIVVE